MENENASYKQDINFLEKPLWSIGKHKKKPNQSIKWIDKDGFQYQCYEKVPNKVDMLVLDYLLKVSQNNDYQTKIYISKYKILKDCGIVPSKQSYERLEETLSLWLSVSIYFSGIWYDGKNYSSMGFGIIESYSMKKDDKETYVRFNDEWITKIKESNYCKYINFEEMKRIRSPLAFRLFEILSKSFHKREKWEIDCHKLANKIPMNEKYVSVIIRRIKQSINIINNETDLNVSVESVKQGKNKGKFIFKKDTKNKQKDVKDDKEFTKLYETIPKSHRKQSYQICKDIYQLDGYNTLKSVLDSIDTDKEIKSYGSLIHHIYKNNLYDDTSAREIPEIQKGMKVKTKSGKVYTIQEGNVIFNNEGKIILTEGDIINKILDNVITIV